MQVQVAGIGAEFDGQTYQLDFKEDIPIEGSFLEIFEGVDFRGGGPFRNRTRCKLMEEPPPSKEYPPTLCTYHNGLPRTVPLTYFPQSQWRAVALVIWKGPRILVARTPNAAMSRFAMREWLNQPTVTDLLPQVHIAGELSTVID